MGRLNNTVSISTMDTGLFWLCFLLSGLWWLRSVGGVVVSVQFVQIVELTDIKFFVMFPYYFCSVYRTCGVSRLSFSILVVCVFPLFSLVWPEVY